MDKQTKIISDLLSVMDNAVAEFHGDIPALQQQMLDDVELLTKQLDTTPDGTIKNNVANLRLIGKIKSKLEQAVLNDDYLKKVKKFVETFKEVSTLQNKYFRAIEDTWKPDKLLAEIQSQAINWTIDNLTEAGIGANVTDQIEELLRANISAGGSYKQLTQQLRDMITASGNTKGLLDRYTRTVTVDSIMQFNRQYSTTVAADLNMDWYWHTGSLIETSRDFCIACQKKKYFHKSELKPLVNGDIFTRKEVPINPKTDLWYGAISGTNENNILINSGGYGCNHIFQPVSAFVVPENIRDQFES
jgi:hypothetical protein